MEFNHRNTHRMLQNQRQQQAEKNQANQREFDSRLSNILDPNATPGFGISGTENEMRGRLEGLERAQLLTGKSPFEIGQMYQEGLVDIEKRRNLSDTASELLRANKSGAVADAKSDLSKAGVKGGTALSAVSQVERAKSYDVNNQLMQHQQKAEADYMNAAKGMANFTTANEMNFGALSAGKDAQMPTGHSNGFGTVICTELWRQGYYSNEVYMADQAYGIWMQECRPEVYYGYRFLADPIIPVMQKSKAFTKLVAFFAVPWAMNMAGRKNVGGSLISAIGEPICFLVGKLINWRIRYGY